MSLLGILPYSLILPPNLSLRFNGQFQVNLGWPMFIEVKDDGVVVTTGLLEL